MQRIRLSRLLGLTPLIGICLFIVLYVVAAFEYPGGSNADTSQKGFNIFSNYWCDLLNYDAKNGDYNTSRPVALAAMILLSVSLALFWYFLPLFIYTAREHQKIIQFSGVFSAVTALFVFTKYHDVVIDVAGLFGAVAFLGAFIGLFKSGWYRLTAMGIFCLVLCLVNYVIYQSRQFVSILPLLQKATFLLCLCWFFFMDIQIYRMLESKK